MKTQWLHVLIENGYSRRLGAVSPVLYVMEHLRYEKTEAYHVVEVATALHNLPRCLKAFERARLSWSQLKRIASVAKPGTEEAWLSFALAHKPGDLKAEARDALRNGRDLPPPPSRGAQSEGGDGTGRRGLPNTIHDLRLPFTLEDRGCHASLHDGSLEVFLDSLGEVHWSSKADRMTPTS